MFLFIRKKIFIYTLLFILGFIAIVFTFYPMLEKKNQSLSNDNTNDPVTQVNVSIEKELVMITHYVVGQDVVETRNEKIQSIDEIKDRFPDWNIVENNNERVVLERMIEDIAPECKKEHILV